MHVTVREEGIGKGKRRMMVYAPEPAKESYKSSENDDSDAS